MNINNEIREKGAAKISQLLTQDDIHELLTLLESVSPDKERGEALVCDIHRPSRTQSALLSTSAYQKCQHIADAYFESKAHHLYDHAIFKWPGSGRHYAHQDQAFLGEHCLLDTLNFWIPLQATSRDNGTIEYADDNQTTYLPHHQCGRAFIVDQPYQPQLIPMDVALGDVTVHTNLKLHGSGENHSDTVRRAWIIHFGRQSHLYKRWLQMKAAVLEPFRYNA